MGYKCLECGNTFDKFPELLGEDVQVCINCLSHNCKYVTSISKPVREMYDDDDDYDFIRR